MSFESCNRLKVDFFGRLVRTGQYLICFVEFATFLSIGFAELALNFEPTKLGILVGWSEAGNLIKCMDQFKSGIPYMPIRNLSWKFELNSPYLHCIALWNKRNGSYVIKDFRTFSPHPNISDGNFNLNHHFFCMQIFQIYEKGAS